MTKRTATRTDLLAGVAGALLLCMAAAPAFAGSEFTFSGSSGVDIVAVPGAVATPSGVAHYLSRSGENGRFFTDSSRPTDMDDAASTDGRFDLNGAGAPRDGGPSLHGRFDYQYGGGSGGGENGYGFSLTFKN